MNLKKMLKFIKSGFSIYASQNVWTAKLVAIPLSQTVSINSLLNLILDGTKPKKQFRLPPTPLTIHRHDELLLLALAGGRGCRRVLGGGRLQSLVDSLLAGFDLLVDGISQLPQLLGQMLSYQLPQLALRFLIFNTPRA